MAKLLLVLGLVALCLAAPIGDLIPQVPVQVFFMAGLPQKPQLLGVLGLPLDRRHQQRPPLRVRELDQRRQQ